MRLREIAAWSSAAVLLGLALGCASTNVATTQQYGGTNLPRPERILVYPFATSPDEVKLDWSPTMQGWRLEGETATQEEKKVGHDVAQALASKLVSKIQALGLPAEIASGAPVADTGAPVVTIDGQFLSINEGNRAERVVIGLGAGRSDVKTAVQVYEMFGGGQRLLDQFEIDAKSGRKPGAAETLGAGGLAGHLAVSAAVTAAGTVGSEAFGDNVDADAERTAAKLANALSTFFVRQGWIAPPKGLF
ncbi:MAG TPA: DUF4410 domain-containing protein [Myxococcota bacterium]|nr:DUF4410 domain-containing protein [Myxococcota bacterium]